MAKNHHRTIIYPRRLFNGANWKITVFHTSSCLLSRNGPWLPVRKALEDPIKLSAWPWRPRPGSHFPAKNRTSHGQFSIAMLPEGSQNGTHQEMPRLAIYWPFSKKWSSYGKNEGCQLSGKKWKNDDHPLISTGFWAGSLTPKLRKLTGPSAPSARRPRLRLVRNAGAEGTIWAVAKGHGWPW